MAKKHIIIRIKELVVTSNGDLDGAAPSHDDELGTLNNSLMASLRYPRSGASQVMSVKQYDLKNGQPANLDDSKNPDPFFDTLLFREVVEDETVLSVKVTNFDKTGKAGKFFLKVFSTAFGAGVGIATGGLSSIVGSIVGFGVEQIKNGTAKAGDDNVEVIGAAKLRIKVSDFTAAPTEKVLDLIAPETISRTFFTPPKPGHDPVAMSTDVTTKSQSNGRLTLEISAIDV